MAVTVTSSVNLIFGSGILEPDTGVILDNTVSRIIRMRFMLLIHARRWTISPPLELPMHGEYTHRLVR